VSVIVKCKPLAYFCMMLHKHSQVGVSISDCNSSQRKILICGLNKSLKQSLFKNCKKKKKENNNNNNNYYYLLGHVPEKDYIVS